MNIHGQPRTIETLTDFENHYYISRVNENQQCSEGDIPAELNVRDVVHNFTEPFNNKTRYLGLKKAEWEQEGCAYHTFEANDEVFYFCPKTMDLKWIR